MKITKEVLYEALFLAVKDLSIAKLDNNNKCPNCKLKKDCYTEKNNGKLCENVLIDFYVSSSVSTVSKRKEMLK